MHGRQTDVATGDSCKALTEKEKQTLRLLLAGHDAKSAARALDLSVHTINERLRDARRKLSVSSSKEAARLLRQSEAADPQSLGYAALGDAAPAPGPQQPDTPDTAPPAWRRAGRAIGGLVMLVIAAAAAYALLNPTPALNTARHTGAPAAAVTATDAARAARGWLELGDAASWDAAWADTTDTFRAANTVETWRSVSEKVRVPLGRVLSRTLLDEQDVPAPPRGYRTVRFRTDFANRRGATETLSMERDGDAWKVAGIYLE